MVYLLTYLSRWGKLVPCGFSTVIPFSYWLQTKGHFQLLQATEYLFHSSSKRVMVVQVLVIYLSPLPSSQLSLTAAAVIVNHI